VPAADFLSADWLAMANAEFALLDLDPARVTRVDLTMPDARNDVPRKVTVDVDPVSGGMRFALTPAGSLGDLRLELPRADAMPLLLGSSRHRCELFETGRIRLTGNFFLECFLDRAIQESKVIPVIRAQTADAPARET
jgi:hypothetical protein